MRRREVSLFFKLIINYFSLYLKCENKRLNFKQSLTNDKMS